MSSEVEKVKKLNGYENDYEFLRLVKDILDNKKFEMMKDCVHHGMSRWEHSMRVSYYSYKIAKKFRLNYIDTARGGLLHDFFVNDDLTVMKQKFSIFFHPYHSLDNAKKYFRLSQLEEDIIINHMFPTLPHKIPKNIESWIVSFVDKIVATYEFYESYGKTVVYKLPNLYVILLLVLHW